MTDILDLGCGNKKRPGAVGIDVNPLDPRGTSSTI